MTALENFLSHSQEAHAVSIASEVVRQLSTLTNHQGSFYLNGSGNKITIHNRLDGSIVLADRMDNIVFEDPKKLAFRILTGESLNTNHSDDAKEEPAGCGKELTNFLLSIMGGDSE